MKHSIFFVWIFLCIIVHQNKVLSFQESSVIPVVPFNTPVPFTLQKNLSKTSFSPSFFFPSQTSSFALGNTISVSEKKLSTHFLHFLRIYRNHLIFASAGLGSLLISGIFNAKIKSQYEKEQALYTAYANGKKGSDFQGLWRDYKNAVEKTDTYGTMRGIFGVTSGGIGLGLLLSVIIEGEF